MNLITTAHPEVLVLEPRVFPDPRGFFFESYSERRMAELGIHTRFVQDNHSKSSKGVVRGLHYQLKQPQTKLCRVVRGAVLDVAVDIRHGSLYFGVAVAVELSEENKRQIYVPRGFAHGFAVLTDEVEFLYKCDDFYAPGDEYGVAWDDPALGINWRLSEFGITEPLLSEKDKKYTPLAKISPESLPLYPAD
jgi:dTDP-4-dehydrorhamnose 3,5-epimerase